MFSTSRQADEWIAGTKISNAWYHRTLAKLRHLLDLLESNGEKGRKRKKVKEKKRERERKRKKEKERERKRRKEKKKER